MKSRGFSVRFNGEDYTLPVDFTALRACAKAGACPLTVITMAAKGTPPNTDQAFAAVDVGLSMAGVKQPAKAYERCKVVEIYNAGIGYIQALVAGMEEDSPV